jgi:hypothetical protein
MSEVSEDVMPRSNATKLVLGLLALVCTASVGVGGTPDLKKPYKERVEAARQCFDVVEKKFEFRGLQLETIRHWGRRLLEAELALCDNKKDKVKAYEAYWKRVKHCADIAEKNQLFPGHQKLAAKYIRLEAEMWLRQQEADPEAVKSVAKARLEAARNGLQYVNDNVTAGRFSMADQRYLPWPRRLLDAQLAVSMDKKGRVTALESYLEFQTKREKITKNMLNVVLLHQLLQAQFDRLEAEIMLKKETDPKAVAALAQKRLEVARKGLKFVQAAQRPISPFEIVPWARHVLEAQLALEPAKDQRIKAHQDYLNQTEKIEKMFLGQKGFFQSSEAHYYRLDAEILLLQAKGK